LKLEIDYFFEKLSEVQKLALPFVIYRKPAESLVLLLVQKTAELYYLNSFDEAGFVFAPFRKNERKIIFHYNHCEQYNLNLTDLTKLTIEKNNVEIRRIVDLKNEKKRHVTLVENAIDFIKKGKAKKVVVSRKESLIHSNFNEVHSFKNMLKIYPDAFVYWWFHPKVGCWMGASPEQFIKIHKNQFKTMALAATQPYKGTLNVTWKHKEQQEQQFVTDYILNTIQHSVSTIKISKPTTVKAGNLLHIKTDITADLTANNSLENLVGALHPTPAVCGLPKDVSMQFILENEGYDRSYYAGFLGEFNCNKSTNLFVNLRCMEKTLNGVSLYIGGGITSESNAEREWEETVFKSEVMKKVV
jgi:isochorismate synthase